MTLDVPGHIAEVCDEYAHDLCWSRLKQQHADQVYATAPKDALPYLDAIKRVMEIDAETTNTTLVLLRAIKDTTL